MRLINTRTLELRAFSAVALIPHYAILSHMWGDDEVSFHDMANLDHARQKAGFEKIERCCKQALRDGLDWAWVDTCCIDKTSSAELSESINSMYNWYARGMKCYAFLSDVSIRQGDNAVIALMVQEGIPHVNLKNRAVLFRSRWWTRGWTLQELIAPHNVEFYNRDWEYVISKRHCKHFISELFGISKLVLDHSAALSSFCVAERISWASSRETTRGEDMAYCLLGILGVNMPLLYGEGERNAFLRLQEQVLSTREDHTLFLWNPAPTPAPTPALERPPPIADVLAPSPRAFNLPAWSPWSAVDPDMLGLGEPPQVTSRGLRLSLFLRQVTQKDLLGSTQLSESLKRFFLRIRRHGFRTFSSRLQPGEDNSLPLYLAAFPSASTSTSTGTTDSQSLPCILLLSVNSATSGAHGPGLRPKAVGRYVRLLSFLDALPQDEVLGAEQWEFKSCYVLTRASFDEAERELRSASNLLNGPRASQVQSLWTWRSSKNIIPATEVNRLARPSRRCLNLQATETFPGAFVYVAAEAGRYWMGHEVAQSFELARLAERFKTDDLDWVETAKKEGPICDQRLDVETGSLLMTLFIDRYEQYRVSLAFVEKSGGAGASQGEAQAVGAVGGAVPG